MNLMFHIQNISFDLFKELASFCEEAIGGELFVQHEHPTQRLKKEFGDKANNVPLTSISSDTGQLELEENNGIYCSSSSPVDWSITVYKQEVLSKPFWSIDINVKNHFEKGFYVDFFINLSEKLSPALAYCFDEELDFFNCRYYSNKFGVWAGLRDIYWLNYYGHEFTNLIGENHLLSLDFADNTKKIGHGVFFQVPEKLLLQRGSVKKKIGEDFFVQEVRETKTDTSEKVGFIALVKTLWQLRKDDGSENELALSRPIINE